MSLSGSIYESIRLQWGNCPECQGGGGATIDAHYIKFASLSLPGGGRTPEMAFVDARNNVVHEFGHVFANLWYYRNDEGNSVYDPSGPYGTEHAIPIKYLSDEGFYLYPEPTSATHTWRQHPCDADGCSPHEVFADMFLGWTFGKWADNNVGTWRDNYMTTNMASWVPAVTRR